MGIDLVTVNAAPVFQVKDLNPNNARIYGAVFDKANSRYLFPAFPPFVSNVVNDLRAIRNDLSFSEEAQKHLLGLLSLSQWREEVAALTLPVPSYDHQLDGLAELIYNYRWALQWQMGTGKTKVAVDAIRLLGMTTLVLCPRIAINTWVQEVKKNTDDTVETVVIRGATRTAKLAQLQRALKYPVIITNYDAVRGFGVPHLYDVTMKFFKDRGIPPSAALRKELLRINDGKEQLRFAKEGTSGRKIPEIHEELLEMTKGQLQWITDLPYTMIIADESHRIKHIQSQRTKICLQLAKRAARRYLLTGTMAPQGDPREIYPQMKFLADYLIPETWPKYLERFLTFAPKNRNIVTGVQNLAVLSSRVSKVSSVKKLDDCVSLPERRFEKLPFNLTNEQRVMYNEAVKNWTLEPPGGSPLDLEHGAIRVNKLLQLCSGFLYLPADKTVCDPCVKKEECVKRGTLPGMPHCLLFGEVEEGKRQTYFFPENPKLDELMDLLEDTLIFPSAKVIIWAYYVEGELDVIERELKKNNIGYVRVDGSNSGRIKEFEDTFKNDPNCRVWLAQIHTGIAVTLNSASYMVYYSRGSVEDREQSLFRNYRIGQTRKTIVYDLAARFSLELQQISALKNKKDTGQLMTERRDCIFCSRYELCEGEKVKPWEEGCILPNKVTREIINARCIPG